MKSFLPALVMMMSPLSSFGADVPWDQYGGPESGDAGAGAKHSPASLITPENARALETYWKLDLRQELGESTDFAPGALPPEYKGRSLQVTPIFADGLLYGCSAFNRVFALDVTSKKIAWRFTPPSFEVSTHWPHRCRGVAYWENSTKSKTAACRKVIFTNTFDGKLYALDAGTGRLCQDFGDRGKIDLKADVSPDPANRSEYALTSAPSVYESGGKSLVVVGGAIVDNSRATAASGVVRAYFASNGKKAWHWDPGASASRGLQPGSPNAWAPITADPKLGLIYVPMGNASPDLFGGQRGTNDRYASSLVALGASSGRVRWHFKTVRNDLWDFDIASQPALFQWKRRPVLALGTKTGYVYLLDRRTGDSLIPTEFFDVPVAQAVSGEAVSPIQLRPLGDFAAHGYPATIDALIDPYVVYLEKKTLEGREGAHPPTCLEQAKELEFQGAFTPPSLKGSISFPGPIGGINWGGVSVDPAHGLLIFNQNRIALVTSLIPRERLDEVRATNPVAASGFKADIFEMEGTPYGARRYPLFSSVLPGIPCTRSPWGELTAIDLNTGKTRWKKPLGNALMVLKGTLLKKIAEIRTAAVAGQIPREREQATVAALELQIARFEQALSPQALQAFKQAIKVDAVARNLGFSGGISDYAGEGFGLPNMGGPMTTASGLVFIGATVDQMFRIYDSATGEVIHEIPMSAPAAATPMTFVREGTQYIVVAAGGNHLIGGAIGDELVILRAKP